MALRRENARAMTPRNNKPNFLDGIDLPSAPNAYRTEGCADKDPTPLRAPSHLPIFSPRNPHHAPPARPKMTIEEIQSVNALRYSHPVRPISTQKTDTPILEASSEQRHIDLGFGTIEITPDLFAPLAIDEFDATPADTLSSALDSLLFFYRVSATRLCDSDGAMKNLVECIGGHRVAAIFNIASGRQIPDAWVSGMEHLQQKHGDKLGFQAISTDQDVSYYTLFVDGIYAYTRELTHTGSFCALPDGFIPVIDRMVTELAPLRIRVGTRQNISYVFDNYSNRPSVIINGISGLHAQPITLPPPVQRERDTSDKLLDRWAAEDRERKGFENREKLASLRGRTVTRS